MPRREFLTGGRYFALAETIARTIFGSKVRNRGGPKLENACPGLPFGHVTSTPGSKDAAPTDVYPTSFAYVNFPQKKAEQGLTLPLSWRRDRNVALDESYPTVVTLWKLFSQSYDSSGERLVDGPFSLPAGRRRSVLGFFPPVETF